MMATKPPPALADVTNILDRVKTKPDPKPKPPERKPAGDWRDGLIVKVAPDGGESPLCRVHNLILILQNAPKFMGRIEYNEFSDRVSIDRIDLDEVGPVKIKAQLEREWIQEKVPTSDVLDAINVVALASTYHPVRDYLSSLEWDGTERIPSFFEDHCDGKRDPYHMAVASSLFVSAVARVMKPGCKVDTMVILESDQGRGKSKLWLALFAPWCCEITAALNDKDFYSNLRGVWCADFSELDAFSRSETTQVKRILTAQSDNYRPHYGRSSKAYPRQCVFVGGTNRDDWHTDSTGGRRFLPVRISHQIDIDGVVANRDQLWAEAANLYLQDTPWWDIPDAAEHQAAAYQGDPWEEPITDYVLGRDRVSVYDVLLDCLRIEKGQHRRSDQMRVSAILKRSGWERKQVPFPKWSYVQKRE